MATIIKKVEGGKLFRLDTTPNDNVILTGDFFMHPEETIKDLNLLLSRMFNSEIESEIIDQFIQENKIELIGVTPQDLTQALEELRQ